MKSTTWIGVALCLVTTFAAAAPRVLTQSVSQTPVGGVSVSCNAATLHTNNSYWRVLNLAPLALPAPLVITGVQFGIEDANAAGVGTTQPVTVRVYTSAGAFPAGARTLRAEQTVEVPDQALSVFTVTFTTPTAPLPVDSIVVLELFTPDGRAAGHRFFIGANSAGESASGFISAPDCGVVAPTAYAAIGFPNIHIILNAVAGENTLAENLACATTAITNMASPAAIGAAQKSTLLGLLKVATANQTGPYRDLARAAANSVLMRTDGCALRGTPDTVAAHGGTGSDFVLNCPAQATVFACVRDAHMQLTAPLMMK